MHKFLPNIFIFLDKYNNQIFKNNITNVGVIYRNYNNKKKEAELIKIAKSCRKKRFKLYVSNDIKLALKVKADGIYIPSFNKSKKFLNMENKKLTILGSAHNQKEIRKKISQKCKAIFLSPIFHTKKRKNFLDIHKFNFITFANKTNFVALGGINEFNFHKLKMLNTKSFAGITLFKKKTGLLKAGFYKE